MHRVQKMRAKVGTLQVIWRSDGVWDWRANMHFDEVCPFGKCLQELIHTFDEQQHIVIVMNDSKKCAKTKLGYIQATI